MNAAQRRKMARRIVSSTGGASVMVDGKTFGPYGLYGIALARKLNSEFAKAFPGLTSTWDGARMITLGDGTEASAVTITCRDY